MAQATDTVKREDLTVVDCDMHIMDRDLSAYLGKPWNRMIREEVPTQALFPSTGYAAPMLGPKVGDRPDDMDYYMIPSAEDAKHIMNKFGTDKAILNASTTLKINNVHHSEFAHGLAQAYNDYLLDNFLDEDDDLYGTMAVTTLKPRKAADEIEDRANESQIAGIQIPSGAVPPLGHERYDPLYEAAEKAGLPIHSHISGMSTPVHFPHMWMWGQKYIDHKVPFAASEYMHHLTQMISNGVFVKFPDLKFVCNEVGAGWVPYFLERFDHAYHGNQQDAAMLEQKPSEYFHDNVWITSQPLEGLDNPDYLGPILRQMKADQNMLFASDFPHHDFDVSDDVFNVIRQEFDSEGVKNIFGGNAMQVYDI